MRLHAFSAVSAALLLVGCGGSADHAPVEAGGADEQAAKAPLALVEALSGTWMPEDYCACLERHRSAYTCGSLLREIYVMTVTPKGPDSLEWGYITTHEGGPEVMLAYDPHVQGFVGQSGEYSTEEVIQVRSVDKDLLELSTVRQGPPRRFVRVESEQELLLGALFSGVFVDEGTGDTVRFHSNGKVTGLPGIDQAIVLTDFTEGLDDRDIVFLYTGQYDWDKDSY